MNFDLLKIDPLHPSLQVGVASASDLPPDALANLKEATELYLENMMLTAELIPIKPFLQVFS
jgi:predicted RNase H-like HicB family nuclease